MRISGSFTTRLIVFGLFLSVIPFTFGQSKPYRTGKFTGRIAYSADGNHNDRDDWAASPVVLAIFAESGLKDRLVHFHYNSILPLTDRAWEQEHALSVLGAAEKYGYDKSLFYDCRKNLELAIDSLAKAVNASTADDPLYFIIAGPVEVPYRALEKARADKRPFVYCISHSRWNDGFASNYKFSFTKRSVIEQDIHWVQIRDQNPLLSLSPYGRPAQPNEFKDFFWMRDSRNPAVQFLWERTLASTRPDPSDAGMAYFLATGDETCDSRKLEMLLEKQHKPQPIVARQEIRIEAENFRHLDGFVLDDRSDKSASHRLAIRLRSDASGSIRTRFDEPFTKETGRYDLLVRYFDGKGVVCHFRLLINGSLRGSAWTSAGQGRGWTDESIHDIAIGSGDEIKVEATGPSARIDYVQLNSK